MRFKPEDFDSMQVMSMVNNLDIREVAAEFANAKLEEWLKDLPKISVGYCGLQNTVYADPQAAQKLIELGLVCIEELNKKD